MKEYIITVDTNDNEIGSAEKIEAHELGLLHRALSIIVINKNKEILLQKRYSGKYHSPGLWTNTCCTHPNVGETVSDAAKRRLVEELGFSCNLEEVFTFIYKASFDNGLTEYEFDHVLIGCYDNKTNPNPQEVEEIKWIELEKVKSNIGLNPNEYTYWFKYMLDNYYDKIYNYIYNN